MRLVLMRLEQVGRLSDSSRTVIIRGNGLRDYLPNAEILCEGNAPTPLWFLSGWACRQKLLDDGRRQIINFILPGDGIGVWDRCAETSSYGVMCLTAVRTLDASAAVKALDDPVHGDLREALHRQAALEEALLYDQIVRLGRRSALERVAHLLLELNARLTRVGLADANQFELPLTQDILADAVGLSVVHVNRTLQSLRREGLVALRGGTMSVLQPAAMREIADGATRTAGRPIGTNERQTEQLGTAPERPSIRA